MPPPCRHLVHRLTPSSDPQPLQAVRMGARPSGQGPGLPGRLSLASSRLRPCLPYLPRFPRVTCSCRSTVNTARHPRETAAQEASSVPFPALGLCPIGPLDQTSSPSLQQGLISLASLGLAGGSHCRRPGPCPNSPQMTRLTRPRGQPHTADCPITTHSHQERWVALEVALESGDDGWMKDRRVAH